MNFLYPGFLFCLFAIAIPILIHLFNFRKFKKVYFSNVQFLKAAQEQDASGEKLKNLLILFSRILALVFLVFAFARPYVSENTSDNPVNGRVVNIYIDNSYSMGSVNKEGTLLDEAKRKAKDIAGQFQPNDRFQLTTNDFEGRHQRPVSYEEFLGLTDELKISPAQRTLQQVLTRQHALQTNTETPYNYIISDFQRNFVGTHSVDTLDGKGLSLVRLKANTIPNIAVDSIWALSPAHRPGAQERFVIRLRNYTNEDSKEIPVKLIINDQQMAVARLKVPADAAVTDTLTFSGLAAGWQKGVVSIKDYPLTFDDELKFSFNVNDGLDILHISGDPLERHISSLFSADEYFRLKTMPESNVQYAGFANYKMIILSGLKTPSSGLAQQLKTFVQNGGTVVVFPDLTVNPGTFSAFLTALNLPSVSSLNKDTVKATAIDLKSNLFNDVFEEIPSKIDLPKVNRHFVFEQTSKSNRENILDLPTGQVLFGRYRMGAGQIYLSSTSLREEDSNFPRHPVFVPLLYKVAFTSVNDQPLYHTIGKDNLLTVAKLSLNPSQSLRLSSGKNEIIPEIRQTPGKTLLYIADQIRSSGVYELKKADSTLSYYAFNDSRAESDMHYASDNELEQIPGKKHIIDSDTELVRSGAGVENKQSYLWKLCLALSALFIAAEILLIRFFNKKNKIQS